MDDTVQEDQSSFGIKKIIDVKINKDGKQMFKVKWEPTWEPVENLVTCQHLIDEFWSFVNKAKVNEKNSLKHKEIFESNSYMHTTAKFPKMSEDDKSEVQRLIARTNQTQTGNPPLVSPNMIFNQQHQQMSFQNQNFHNSPQKPIVSDEQDQKPFVGTNPSFPSASPSQKPKITSLPKTDLGFSPGKDKISSNSALKYVENFDNPYVKIILVCKICNKEQKLKSSSNWKTHYLSHASADEKPHPCPYCPKAFITLTQKTKHMKTHQIAMTQQGIKGEQMNHM